ncbi:MAG: hypothetical protein NXH88_19115, partial [Hyphomonas sp.]|nr:hypothetical protein [Hyphomonas sp.]
MIFQLGQFVIAHASLDQPITVFGRHSDVEQIVCVLQQVTGHQANNSSSVETVALRSRLNLKL